MPRPAALLLALALAGCGGEGPPSTVRPAAERPPAAAHGPAAATPRPDPTRAPAPAGDEREPAGAPVHARFLDARTDRPLAGRLVRVVDADGAEVEWCVTDADGWTIAVEDAPFGPVELVLERPGLVPDLRFAVEHAPDAAPVLHALVGADLASPVRARLVDERTGAPLAGLAVQVTYAGAPVETATTDADGRLATEAAVPHGPVELVVELGPLLPPPTLAAGHGPQADLAFALDPGELLELAVEPPSGTRVVDLALLDATGEVVASAPEHRLGTPLRADLADVHAVRARTGDRLWEGTAVLEPGGPARATPAGATPARATPARATPARATPARATVVLEPRGTVRVRVRDPQGRTPDGAVAFLHGADGVFRSEPVDPDSGTATLAGLRPDAYTLAVGAPGCERVERPVRVHELEWTELDVELVPLPIAGAVEGVLTTVTGQPVEPCTVTLLVPGAQLEQRVEWHELDGRQVAPFRFERVPVGEHRLFATGPAGLDWTPSAPLVSAPAAGLELCCDDRPERVWLLLTVLEAETGAPPPSWRVEVGDARGMGPWRWFDRGDETLLPWVARPDLAWIVQTPGRRPAVGGLADLRATEVPRSCHPLAALAAEVLLERTDAHTIFVRDEADRPLPGVRVTLDGARVGVTDALGAVEATRGAWPPERWTFELEGWTLDQVSWEDAEEVAETAQRAWMVRQ